MDPETEPLLDNNGETAPWGTSLNDEQEVLDMDVAELLQHPESVISVIEKFGVARLGEFEIEDSVAIRAFSGRNLLTIGADTLRDFDWKRMWYEELDKSRQHGKFAEAGWIETVVVEAHVLCIRCAAGPPGQGLLQPILMRYEKKACPLSVFGLPAVQAILDYKWEEWASHMLKIEFIIYIGWLASFTIFVILLENRDPSKGLTFVDIWNEGGVQAKLTVILNFSAVTFMAPFLLIELNTLVTYGKQWLQLWNLLDVATYTIQIFTCYIYCSGNYFQEDWFTILLSLQCIFLFTKVQYFSRVFASAKSSLVDILKVVISDVKWFLIFLLLTLFSFALAFYILYRDDGEDTKLEFESVRNSIVSMFSFMLGGFDFHVFFQSNHVETAIVFFVLYEFTMAIMALNLLIAIMTDSYSKVMENEQVWNLCSKAQIIDELETSLPKWIVRRWNPRYVHILKISPRKEVDMSSLMDRLDVTEGALFNTSQELSVKMSDMERRVMNRLEYLSKELELLQDQGKGRSWPAIITGRR